MSDTLLGDEVEDALAWARTDLVPELWQHRQNDLRHIRTLVTAVERQAAYVTRLEHHLEIDRMYEMKDGEKVEVPVPPAERESMIASGLDGIGCRDETIKLQDLRIASLKERLTLAQDDYTRDHDALAVATARLATAEELLRPFAFVYETRPIDEYSMTQSADYNHFRAAAAFLTPQTSEKENT